MHPNLIHPNQSLPLSHSYPPPSAAPVHPTSKRPSRTEDDDEIVAKKKKNADAQAAFRLRRQTYIKSLEDTVSELKNAVSEMEVLVKTANHDVKLQRERVAFLDAKLKQANQSSAETMNEGSGSSHCTCCRYAPPNDQAPQHHASRLPTSTSPTSLINPATPTVPTPVSTPVHTPQTIQHQRDWPSHSRPYSSVFVSQPHPPRANSPQQPAYNRLLHRHPTTEQHDPTGNSNYGTIFFEPFTTSAPSSTSFYHPSLDVHHHHHHPSSPPLDSPRTAAYMGVHQPASRAWPDYGIEPQKQSYKHEEPRLYTDDQQQQKRRREEEAGGAVKLNGLPAKVARCNQAVMEVSKVVEQAKLATAAGVSPTKFEFGGAGVV